jgi:hypothetical protein
MSYVQFIIPSGPMRKAKRMVVLSQMLTWLTYYEIKFEVDLAGYELNYHFTNPVDLSFFIMNPPDLAEKFAVVS